MARCVSLLPNTARVSHNTCGGKSGLLIGPHGFGSARQAVLPRLPLAVLGSVREREEAVPGNVFGLMQPPTPLSHPLRRALANSTQTRTAVARGAGAREGPKPRVKMSCELVAFGPPRPLTRCDGACWRRGRRTRARARALPRRRHPERAPSRAAAPSRGCAKPRQRFWGIVFSQRFWGIVFSPGYSEFG